MSSPYDTLPVPITSDYTDEYSDQGGMPHVPGRKVVLTLTTTGSSTVADYDSLNDEEYSSYTNDYWKHCNHHWVDTGMPGGMNFCKHCDLDFEEYEALTQLDRGDK